MKEIDPLLYNAQHVLLILVRTEAKTRVFFKHSAQITPPATESHWGKVEGKKDVVEVQRKSTYC